MQRPAVGAGFVAAMVAWRVCVGTQDFFRPFLIVGSRPQLRKMAAQSGTRTVQDNNGNGSVALRLGVLSVAAGILHVAALRQPSSRRRSVTGRKAVQTMEDAPDASQEAIAETKLSGTADITNLDVQALADVLPPAGNEESATESINPFSERGKLKVALLRMAAASSRGEKFPPIDLEASRHAAKSLEALNPITSPTLAPECIGTWELVFADTQLFRSSPFFMAGRALCREGDEAARYDWFCDMHRAALAFSNVGKVRQIISSTAIISEFEVQVGAAPVALGYPININGAIVSTESIAANRGDGFELAMESVEIKGSNMPVLRQVLDAGVQLRTREAGSVLENVVRDRELFPTPLFRTTYLDSELRISRDQDGKLFVYSRVSDATIPTNYEDVPSDLGVSQLLEGTIKTVLG